ncbi:hypothetical protein SKAU_G00182110 [Synaphobranchus kaupii]|uniref:Uncharacterized protein n=1 Tax=Synaphobranchus kaupii TaxID=118154 RepID=A0A9Q1IUC1_SYNKA|nr:hypothetical protein SKAU_G00182110 [Synaphobranchus kaupii]
MQQALCSVEAPPPAISANVRQRGDGLPLAEPCLKIRSAQLPGGERSWSRRAESGWNVTEDGNGQEWAEFGMT